MTMLFSLSYWKQALLDGLRLFEARRITAAPVPRAVPKPVLRPSPKGPVVTGYAATNVLVLAEKKLARAPRGGQALVVQAQRESRPNTPGSGRRNGSR